MTNHIYIGNYALPQGTRPTNVDAMMWMEAEGWDANGGESMEDFPVAFQDYALGFEEWGSIR